MQKTLIIFLLAVASVANAQLPDGASLITLEAITVEKPLYFSSTIQPIKTTNITTKADGVITKQQFIYGEDVQQGQVLFTLDSSSIEKDYHAALTEYLRSKEKFFINESKYKETKQLYDLGIIPRNEYESIQSNFNHANVSYLQATYKLNDVMKATNANADAITGLDISNVLAVDQALKIRYNCVPISAPSSGVVLTAGKQAVGVGQYVKAGDAIATIGDMQGLALAILVAEVDIREIRIGQKATITGVAFPEIQLEGEVVHVDMQANMKHGFGVPLFSVNIEVNNFPAIAKELVKVGMSAKIKLSISMPELLQVPISAVYQQDNNAMVNRYVDGQIIPTVVVPSRTTIDSVEIVSGLTPGEQIVVPG